MIAISSAKERACNHATDSYVSDVRFGGIQDWTYTHPDLWRDYVKILRFSKAAHSVFQTLIEPLNSVFDSIPTGSASADVAILGKCDRAFSNYCRQQRLLFHDKIGPNWEEAKTETSKSIQRLIASPITKQLLNEAPGFHNMLNEQIDNYLDNLEVKLVNWVKENGGLVKLLGGSETGHFAAKIRELSGCASEVVMDADALIVNLVDMLR